MKRQQTERIPTDFWKQQTYKKVDSGRHQEAWLLHYDINNQRLSNMKGSDSKCHEEKLDMNYFDRQLERIFRERTPPSTISAVLRRSGFDRRRRKEQVRRAFPFALCSLHARDQICMKKEATGSRNGRIPAEERSDNGRLPNIFIASESDGIPRRTGQGKIKAYRIGVARNFKRYVGAGRVDVFAGN